MRTLITKNTATLFLLLFVAVSVSQVHAQSRPKLTDVDARLQRVERVLDQSLLDLLQRIESLQAEVRGLRGEIESLNYENEALKKRSRDLYRDTDQRITDLENIGSSSVMPALSDELSESPVEPSVQEAAVFVANSNALPQPRTSSSSAPAAPAVPVTGSNTRAATAAEKTSYTKAYDLLARGQNDEAVAGFDTFLRTYPDGPYSDNAWYWQGEAKYAQRRFDEALHNFGVVVESFPSSPKVPDARLKIGFALYEQQRFGEARQVLDGVTNDYPGRSAAVLARKRLQQMEREGR